MNRLRGIHTVSIGRNRGKGRIWLENLSLLDADFTPGTPVTIEYGHTITIRKAEDDGDIHISSRKRKGHETPILDLNSETISDYFTYKEKIRVEIQQGEIRISKLQSFRIVEDNAPSQVTTMEKFQVVELPSGAGLGGYAFENTGLFEVAVAGDIDMTALEALRYNQPNPVLYWSNMFDIHQDDIPSSDVFIFTPDCTPFSRLGRRNYVCSASAPMVHHGLRIISAKRFPVVLIENVPEFGNSSFYQHYKRMMVEMDYNVSDRVLQAWDFGTIASRPRFISVAVQKPFEFEFPEPNLNAAHRDKVKKFVREIEDRKWMSISENRTLRFFFGEHRSEQMAKGNGFGISEDSLVTLDHKRIPAFIANYHKIQSTGPFLRHPKNPNLLSMFEPNEILAIQGFNDYEMPEHLSKSTQYRLIGQAICGRMFRALAVAVASVLMQMRLRVSSKRRTKETKQHRFSKATQLDLGLNFA
ncbi:DNA cytosine methyltransferase [Alicyclobacillus fodiniaquatilis]|uniref:DNA (cytosine-5-)-methyltransferase n=1 Tax=Alicyclobacillus fodiniaquatilis TaxID=1661150 RepID=A0ABW4JKN6_9BACL